MSRGCKDGRRRREVCLWMGVGDIERVQMNQGKERVEKLLLAPLFLHPNNVPFLLVVWKTLTPPPPFCYHSHTCQPRSASQSPAHGQMAWPRPGPAQMTHTSESRGDDYEEDHIWLLNMRKPALSVSLSYTQKNTPC